MMVLAHVAAIVVAVHVAVVVAVASALLLLLAIVSSGGSSGSSHAVVAGGVHVVVHAKVAAHIVEVSTATAVSAVGHVGRPEVGVEHGCVVLAVLLALGHGLLHLNLCTRINTCHVYGAPDIATYSLVLDG